MKGITLRHLLFTGKDVKPSLLTFKKGLNIVYGASNAGKSYMLEVLNFMLGGSAPAVLARHGSKYDMVLLAMDLPDGRTITLRRPRRGAGLLMFEGAPQDGVFEGQDGIALSPKHGAAKDGSVSQVLLRAIGIEDAFIASTQVGEKAPLSIRHMMPYVLVDEERMFSKNSPILINTQSWPTLSKNVFRFLLTGLDDSAIVEVPNQDTLKATNSGRVAMLEDLIVDLDAQLADVDVPQIADQHAKLVARMENISAEVEAVQGNLDERIAERRRLSDEVAADQAKAAQLVTMGHRFIDLRDVYNSDIRRLEAIEEGGFLLRRFENKPCPLCGAEPGHQHKPHALGGLEKQHEAAQAEIAKIKLELRDLKATLASMDAEHKGIMARVDLSKERITVLDREIRDLRPYEASNRENYRVAQSTLDDLNTKLQAAAARANLLAKKQVIEATSFGKQSAVGLVTGISGPMGHDFASVVQDVLEAWGYPGIEAVAFDLAKHDITFNGQDRANNGKGVKALFHSAFVVATLLWCKDEKRNLPHPGFIVLDSPLVTYRRPVHYEKHGELGEDEKVVAATKLDQKFYNHLASLSDLAQIIVVENNNPPSAIVGGAWKQLFSGENGDGRQGLFEA